MGSGVLISSLLALLLAAASGEDGDAVLQELLLTRAPTVASADGSLRVSRAYDSQGRLTRLELQEGPLRRVIDVREGGRVVETLVTREGSPDERRLERYDVPGRLTTREFERGGTRTVWRYGPGGRALRKELRLQGSKWSVVSTREEDAFDARIPRIGGTSVHELAGDPWTQYFNCQVAGGRMSRADADFCEDRLWTDLRTSLVSLRNNLDRVVPVACEDDGQVFLGSGFRVDRRSCDFDPARRGTEDDPIRPIDDATRLITGPLLSCLRDLNPSYASQFVAHVLLRRPRIQCTGTDTGRAAVIDNWCGGTPVDSEGRITSRDECRSTWGSSPLMERSFYSHQFPHDIQINPIFDPNSDRNRRSSTSYSYVRSASNDDQVSTLAGLLFHESLHAAGHSGYHNHNEPSIPQIDDVYGCEAVCTLRELPSAQSADSPIMNLSREGCLACMRSGPESPTSDSELVRRGAQPRSERERRLCGGYPTAAQTERFTRAMLLAEHTHYCRERLGDVSASEASARFTEYASTEREAGVFTRYPSCKYLARHTDFDARCPRDAADFLACLDRNIASTEAAFRSEKERMIRLYPELAPKFRQFDAGRLARRAAR